MHRPLWRIVKSNNNKNNNIPMERAPGFVTGGVSAARRSAGWARPALLPHPCPGRGRRLHGPGALAVPARASTARSRRVPVRTYHQVVKGTTRSCPPPEPRSISSPKTVGCVLAPASAHQPDLQLGRVLMRMSA